MSPSRCKKEKRSQEQTGHLEIVPRCPSDLEELNPFVTTVLGHSKLIRSLLVENSGVLVRDKSEFSISPLNNEVRVPSLSQSAGCLFFPENTFCPAYLLKTIKAKSDKLENIEVILSAVESQLEKINTCVRQERGVKSRLPVQIVFLISKPNEFEEFQRKCNQKEFDFNKFTCLDIPKVLFKIMNNPGRLKQRKPENSCQKTLLTNFLDMLKKDTYVQPKFTDESFQSIAATNVKFSDSKSVEELMSLYFQSKHKELKIVPNLDAVCESLLYNTTATGNWEELNSTAKYMGEMVSFKEKFISKLTNTSGILLKNFTNEHVEVLLQKASTLNLHFEIDWLFCGNFVVAFEVGLTGDLRQCLRNKIEQSFTRILPAVQFVMFSLMLLTQNEIHEAIADRIRVAVVLPNVSFESLEESFGAVSHERAVSKILSSFNKKQLGNVIFIPLNSDETAEPHRSFKIEKTEAGAFKLVKSDQQIEHLMKSGGEECDKQFDYLASLLVLSVLKTVPENKRPNSRERALQLDERYVPDYERWARKRDAKSYRRTEFILSPEQHKILNENKDFLILHGEPGTGKTMMLLEKAAMSAEDESVNCVVIAFSFRKKAYECFLRRMIEKSNNEKLKDKLYFLKFDCVNFTWKCIEDKLGDPKRVVVLVDEIITDLSNFNIFLAGNFMQFCFSFKSCWVACILTVRSDDLLDDKYKLGRFCVQPLHVLFRSCQSISEFTNNYLHMTKKPSESSARVPGVLISSSSEMIVDYYNKQANPDGKRVANILSSFLKDETRFSPLYEDDRRFIIFTNETKQFWYKRLKDVAVTEEKIHIEPPDIRAYNAPSFTGNEAMSVVMILDEMYSHGDGTVEPDGLFLAVTRAQCEIAILINDKYKGAKNLEKLLNSNKPKNPVASKVVRDVETTEPIKFSDLSQLNVRDLHYVVLKLANKIDQKFLEKSMAKTNATTKFQLFLTVASDNAFANLCKIIQRTQDTNSVTVIETLEFFGKQALLEQVELQRLNVLFYAVVNSNPEIIKWCIEFTKRNGCLADEMDKLYTDEKHTLLTLLFDAPLGVNRYRRNIWLSIDQLFKNEFPEHLLLHEYEKMNMFQWILHEKNVDFLLYVLRSEKLKEKFLGFFGYRETNQMLLNSNLSSGNNGGILHITCLTGSPDDLRWVLNFFKENELSLELEMNTKYKFYKTNLIALCSNQKATADCISRIIERGFSESLILERDEIFGFRALDWAMTRDENDLVEVILKDDEWCKRLFDSADNENYQKPFMAMSRRLAGSYKYKTVIHLINSDGCSLMHFAQIFSSKEIVNHIQKRARDLQFTFPECELLKNLENEPISKFL